MPSCACSVVRAMADSSVKSNMAVTFKKVKEIIASGALGRVHTVYGTTLGWLLQMGSHVVDYCRYFSGEADAEWVFGQVSGGEKLTDSHPSPDFALGEIQFRNGVRGLVEIGNLAQDVPEVEGTKCGSELRELRASQRP